MDAGANPPSVPITVVNNHSTTSTGSKSASIPMSIIIIFVAAIAIIIILCMIRFICRRYFRHSHGSSYVRPISRTIGNGSNNTSTFSEHERLKQIDALPLITLASSIDKLPKSDCAVCYEPFLPDSVLRLLPACCHAFHKNCIDTWLLSNPSCPMCRSSITLPSPPLQNPLQSRSSRSFRIELGNISLKRSESSSSQIQNQIVPPIRTYSMESHDYHIGEEIEIVPLQPPVVNQEKREIDIFSIAPPPPPPPAPSFPPLPPQPPPVPPSAPPIESLDREEPVRGWLQDFLETLSSAASSTRFSSQHWNETLSSAASSRRFPSQRWSGRWSGRWSPRSSQRFDSGVGVEVEPPPDTWLWDLEAGPSEVAGDVVAIYRWFTGF